MLSYAQTIELGKPTAKLHVGFPHLHRVDLLDKAINRLLEGSRVPDSILVVDNGGRYKAKHKAVTVLRPGYNMGVAASWNLIEQYYGDEDVCISNDDIFPGRRTVEWMGKLSGWMLTAFSYGFFCRRKICKDTIGPFDEYLWPMYWEDCDHDLRMFRAMTDTWGKDVTLPHPYIKNYAGIIGIEWHPEAECDHMEGGSKTHQPWMWPWIRRVENRFHRKWGAMDRVNAPHLLPYLGAECNHYEEYWGECYGNPGFQPYMDHLVELSKECDHAVEVLAYEVGRWTMCLLRGVKEQIQTYCWNRSQEWDYLPRVAKHCSAELKLVTGYNPFDQIPETDLLFVNEEADPVTKLSFVRQHSRVRKHIVFLGPDHASCPTRDAFRLLNLSDWNETYHLNGMTVFSRTP